MDGADRGTEKTSGVRWPRSMGWLRGWEAFRSAEVARLAMAAFEQHPRSFAKQGLLLYDMYDVLRKKLRS